VAVQAAQIAGNRFLPVNERSIGIFIYLTMELCYTLVAETQVGEILPATGRRDETTAIRCYDKMS
jgi:hypothetical protein